MIESQDEAMRVENHRSLSIFDVDAYYILYEATYHKSIGQGMWIWLAQDPLAVCIHQSFK